MENINWYEAIPSYLPQDLHLGVSNSSFLLWVLIATVFLNYVLYKTVQIFIYLRIRYTLIEIKPTDRTNKSGLSTTNLFTILHSIENPKSFINRLFKISSKISYEIVSTKNEGIRYILSIPAGDLNTIRRSFMAYLPGVEITEANDFLGQANTPKFSKIIEIAQTKSYLYPLKSESVLTEHDPIAYLTTHMTKMKPDELVAIQFVTSPISEHTHNRIYNQIIKIKSDLLDGRDITKYLTFNPFFLSNFFQYL